MPIRPARPCSQPGCPALVRDGSRCEAHQRPRFGVRDQEVERAYDRSRGSARERGYDHRWKKLRERVLALEPLCRMCSERGETTLAAMVHHIKPIREGGARLDEANLEPLCEADHALRHRHDRRRPGGGHGR